MVRFLRMTFRGQLGIIPRLLRLANEPQPHFHESRYRESPTPEQGKCLKVCLVYGFPASRFPV